LRKFVVIGAPSRGCAAAKWCNFRGEIRKDSHRGTESTEEACESKETTLRLVPTSRDSLRVIGGAEAPPIRRQGAQRKKNKGAGRPLRNGAILRYLSKEIIGPLLRRGEVW